MSTRGTGPDLEARLRAADPAANAEPDVRALRAAVDARIADAAEDVPGTTAAGTDELARARSRRRLSWPARVASAAAAALVVGGGGGYAIGAMGEDGPSQPALTLVQPGSGPEAGPLSATAMGGAPEMAMDAAAPRVGLAGQDMAIGYWGYGGRTLFDQSGLSTERASGPVWAFDTAAAWSEETLRTAAAALGVTGEPQQQGTVWRIGPQDGTGPAAELYGDGTVTFGYWDPTKDPWRCEAVMPEPRPLPEPDASVDGDASSSAEAAEPSMEIMPVEPTPCVEQELGSAPTGDAAIGAVRDVLGAMGVDVGAHEFAVDSEGEGPWTYVSAYQVLDGRRTGAMWSAGLTGAGLSSLHGQMAPLVELGQYDVVSPAEAVERLTDPRFGSSGPVAWREGHEPAWSEPGPGADGPPATPSAGADLAWPVTQVTIVEATLGSAMHWTPQGAALLVPTYELVDARGAVWTVVAVTDDHLDMASR